MGETKCRYCTTRNLALFAGLDEGDLRHVHQPIKEVALAQQDALYRMNERGSALFTLRGGVMKLLQYLPDGSQRIVRLLRDSDALGLEALVGQPYQHDAIALTDCMICVIPVEVVDQLGREQPRLYRELMTRWQQAKVALDAPNPDTRSWIKSRPQQVALVMQISVAEHDRGNAEGAERVQRLSADIEERLNDYLVAHKVPPVREVVIQDLVITKP